MFEHLSRKVTKLLRHDTAGLDMTYDGFVNVSDLLAHFQHQYTEDDIREMVRTDSKQRYCLQENRGNLQIRATNGHTLEVDVRMKQTDKTIGLHGTYLKNWENIKLQGLSRKTRNFIHMASHDPSCKSGIPSDRDVIIEIDIRKAKKDGIPFFESENGIILSPGNKNGVISKKYFRSVSHKHGVKLSLD